MATIPLRQPGLTHHAPRLALWLGRNMIRRVDLQQYPMQVSDHFVLDDDDHPRALDGIMLFANDRLPLVPGQITYGFPYARSRTGQIQWKRAHVEVRRHGG